MLMDWNDRYECYEEKCPACGYSYIPDDRSGVGDEPFLEVQNHDKTLYIYAKYDELGTSKRYSCHKPVHICPKCGTMGIQVG